MLDNVTLDQLRMLVAIAETGSFTAAAKRVQRAQSAVSHAIHTLENQLQVQLFDRSEKRPVITPAGRDVLIDARLTLARIDQLKARAKGLSQGIESQLSIAVTVLAELAPVIQTLTAFKTVYPTVAIELFVEEIGGSAALVHERICDLGVTGTPSLRMVPAGDLTTIPCGHTDIVAVARPDHPLASWHRELSIDDLNEHRQLIPTSPRLRAAYPNTLARDVWRVADLPTRRSMILAGAGWGTVPKHVVRDELQSGALVELKLGARPPELMGADLFMIHRADVHLGPAGSWLLVEMKHALLQASTFLP
jgi:DNA-binding transcriptional LysR family regulator